MIGKQEKPNDMSYRGFVLIFMVTCVFITLITGIHFSIVSMRVKENPTVMWKGRIILLSFILFAIGGLGDALVQANEIIVIILFRVLLVLSSTFFYIGFIMPKWMKKILSLE